MKLTEVNRRPPEHTPPGEKDYGEPQEVDVVKIQGREVGEIYRNKYGWGYLNYATDFGADHIDSRRDAIEALMWDLVERG